MITTGLLTRKREKTEIIEKLKKTPCQIDTKDGSWNVKTGYVFIVEDPK